MVRSGDQILPSLALRLSMVSLGVHEARVLMGRNPNAENQLAVKNIELVRDGKVLRSISTDSIARLLINYAGPGYTYPHISAKELLDRSQKELMVTQRQWDEKSASWRVQKRFVDKKKFLAGKKLFMGVTAIGLYDLRVTPFDENFPGVEKHANVLDNIVNHNELKKSAKEPLDMCLAVLVVGLFLSLLLPALNALATVALATSLLGLTFAVDWYFFRHGWVLAVFFVIAVIVTVSTVVTVIQYFLEERDKKKIRGTFEKYVSPAIVKEVMAHPDNIRLGGRKEHMSVFFSDVRGFTTISESLDPEALSDLLNRYLTPMTEMVFQNQGTLDKYMGDAVMAFFGAPIPSQTHAENACRCALQSIERLNQLNRDLKAAGLDSIDIGIGVNTGSMSVGNMGSKTVRSYTVMGDAVNLGSRIEGLTKQYGVRILISEFTEKEIGSGFIRREVDWVRVKGKKLPVKVFELMAEGELPPEREAARRAFAAGYAAYRGKDWSLALQEFSAAAETDRVCEIFVKRCQNYLEEPPPADWDGVYVMKTK